MTRAMSKTALITALSSLAVAGPALSGPIQDEYEATIGNIVSGIMAGIAEPVDIFVNLTTKIMYLSKSGQSSSSEVGDYFNGSGSGGVQAFNPSAAEVAGSLKTIQWEVVGRTRTVGGSGGQAGLGEIMDGKLPSTNLATLINRMIDAGAIHIAVCQRDHTSAVSGFVLGSVFGSATDPLGGTPASTNYELISFSGGTATEGASGSTAETFGL
jgi:hypothetical protein